MNTQEKALKYLKENKEEFLSRYISGYSVQDIKIAIFTAGASGAGKTEYAISRKSKETFLLHIDIDEVRDFFAPIGYSGTNSSEYQKPASKGVNWIFDKATKKGYSLIMDSNFAEPTIAHSNVQRLLDKEYVVEINYIFRKFENCYEFAQKREDITKRKVPMDVVKKTMKGSFEVMKACFLEQ